MHTVFASAGRYRQGQDATDSLVEEMRFLGLQGPVAVVTGPTVRGLLEDRWSRLFEEAGIDFQLIPFPGECSRKTIANTIKLAEEQSAAVVMGAGGGKVLDTARAAAAALKCSFVCCPTVASTDSPCSALSVVYSDEGVYEGFDSFGRNPDLVLVDTQVIVTGPERHFVAGMGDALSTVFEARACLKGKRTNLRGGLATIAATEIGEACFRTVIEEGRTALGDLRRQDATGAFERVVEANTLLSGIGFESAGLAAAHGLHNAMTVAEGTHEFMHGEKVAFGVMAHLELENQPTALVEEVQAFCIDVGLPVTLEGVGLSSDDESTLRSIADLAAQPGGLVHNEPFEVTTELVLDAMLAADRRGRAAVG